MRYLFHAREVNNHFSGVLCRLKADISRNKPKTNENEENQKGGKPISSGQGNEDEETHGDEEKDSNDEKYSDEEDASQTFTGSQVFSESQEEIEENADTSICSEKVIFLKIYCVYMQCLLSFISFIFACKNFYQAVFPSILVIILLANHFIY